jgi:hypothetical protein
MFSDIAAESCPQRGCLARYVQRVPSKASLVCCVPRLHGRTYPLTTAPSVTPETSGLSQLKGPAALGAFSLRAGLSGVFVLGKVGRQIDDDGARDDDNRGPQ